MKTVALIPARGGSKRVPGKNMANLGRYPLLWYSVMAALLTPEIDDVVVSSDNDMTLNFAEEYGAIASRRPAWAAADESTDKQVVAHFLEWYGDYDSIIYLRPTTPFRKIQEISKAIKKFKDNESGLLRSVHEMSESAFKCCELTRTKKFIRPISPGHFDRRNQDCPRTFQPNGYVDIWDPRKPMDEILSHVTPAVTELDTYRDYQLLNFELEQDYGGEYVFK